MIVPKGFTYYIDSLNTYHLQAIIPLAPYNYRVEVLYPVNEIIPQKEVIPDIVISDIIDWLPSLKDYIDDENHALHNLTKMLIEVAKMTINYALCGNPLIFKRIVALYVGHYLEFHFAELKDEKNKMSLSPYNENKEIKDKEIEISYDTNMGEYKKTAYGRQFWDLYGQHTKYLVGYKPL